MTTSDRTALASAISKARRRLIPFLFLLYIVAYLDRVNVGFAALQMNQALGFSARTYGLGSGIFFLSYVAFEIPSNVILARVGARLWIARIMITWGLVSSAMMFVRGAGGFYAMRFLLGAAEAGFFPGIIFYLTRWFPERERARTIAAFMTAVLAAGIVGGPLSGALLSLDGLGTGRLAVAVPARRAAVGAARLRGAGQPDRGAGAARWLTAAERAALAACLAAESAAAPGDHGARVLASGRVWLLAVVYFTIPVALYGMSFWLPQILKTASGGSDFEVGLLSAIPYLVGAVGHGRDRPALGSDGRAALARGDRGVRRRRSRSRRARSSTRWCRRSCCCRLPRSALRRCWARSGRWPRPPSAASGAAAGIALINSVGNIGGFVGPYLLGWVLDTTHSFAAGLVAIGAILIAGGALVLRVRD